MSPQRSSNSKSINTANKEWPEISTSASRLSPADPTPREVKVKKSLSAQDLKSLKESDPFLYYSIPDVREATIRLEDEDVDMHQVALNGLKEHCQSHSASKQNAMVKRCTRFSFECHTDLLLDLDELSNALADIERASEDLPPVCDLDADILLNLLERA